MSIEIKFNYILLKMKIKQNSQFLILLFNLNYK